MAESKPSGKTTTTGEPSSNRTMTAPVVIDLGKTSKKKIKALLRGEGSLIDEVQEAVLEVASQSNSTGLRFVPVVVLYKQKKKSSGGIADLFPFPI